MRNKRKEEQRKSKLTSLAEGQGGYFTSQQAKSAGYSYRVQYHHKQVGNWKEIERGVFRFASFLPSEHEDLVRISFWSRTREGIPQAVFSHETALAMHELGDVMPYKIHFTVPKSFRKEIPDNCKCYKRELSNKDIEKREGYMVTTPVKTIVDTAESSIGEEQLEIVVRDAIRKGLVRPSNFNEVKMSRKGMKRLSIVLENIKKIPFF